MNKLATPSKIKSGKKLMFKIKGGSPDAVKRDKPKGKKRTMRMK